MKIGEQEYEIGILTAMEQLKVARKLAPALPIIEGLTAERNAGKDVKVLTILMMAKLSDEDSQSITETCLGAVKRRQGDALAHIMVNGNMMFADITLDSVLQLTTAVIMDNLGSFFKDALAGLKNGAALP